MIVIDRNGKRTVITGWRAWLILVPAVLLVAAAMVALIGVMLGAALTVGTLLLFGLPLAVALLLLTQLVQAKR